MHPVVAALRFEEKGLVLGALLGRMAPEDAAARFGGDSGARCRAALEAVSAETRSGRSAALAALLALVRAPVPAGIERVHPDWLRDRLQPEPGPVIRAVTDGLPLEVRRVADQILGERGEKRQGPAPAFGPAGLAELRRAVFAGLVPLTGPGIPAGSAVQALLSLSFAALDEVFEARGARTLGTSLRGAPAQVIARAAAGLGGRRGGAVLEAAAAAGTVADREAARRLVARTSEGKEADGELAWNLGARALAAELTVEGTSAVQGVAQRLPLARGRRWLGYARESEG